MENKLKILIIEDDRYIYSFTSVSLKKEGHEVVVAESATQGRFLFTSEKPDLVLLDLGLPDEDGIVLLGDFRQRSDVPIIIVSARGNEKEKVVALDLGADDYITKPFSMNELLARVRVFERRLSKNQASEQKSILQLDYLTIDMEKRRVFIDDNEVHLTPIEYKLLLLLVKNRGKVLTHNYILSSIWGYEGESDTTIVRVFMANLRRKIEKDNANPRFILTEVRVGYRFSDEF